MKDLIEAFPQQLHTALQIASDYQFRQAAAPKQQVVIAGLGGSGIGAEIIQNYLYADLGVPLVVCKDYTIPGFVNDGTLVIVCSYSGNTEETLTAMEAALQRRAAVVAVTSGGKIAEIANARQLDCIQIPSGMPPRACLGYSLVQLMRVLEHYGFIRHGYAEDIGAAADFVKAHSDQLNAEALKLAEKLSGKLPVLYADRHISGVATRWRQQINENGKMLGWERVLPEMNHNELVGWREKNEGLAVVFLQSGLESARIRQRIALNKSIIEPYTSSVFEIIAEGKSYFERAFYLIHLGDWLSWHLAQLRNMDATEVRVIDHLKSSLAEKPL